MQVGSASGSDQSLSPQQLPSACGATVADRVVEVRQALPQRLPWALQVHGVAGFLTYADLGRLRLVSRHDYRLAWTAARNTEEPFEARLNEAIERLRAYHPYPALLHLKWAMAECREPESVLRGMVPTMMAHLMSIDEAIVGELADTMAGAQVRALIRCMTESAEKLVAVGPLARELALSSMAFRTIADEASRALLARQGAPVQEDAPAAVAAPDDSDGETYRDDARSTVGMAFGIRFGPTGDVHVLAGFNPDRLQADVDFRVRGMLDDKEPAGAGAEAFEALLTDLGTVDVRIGMGNGSLEAGAAEVARGLQALTEENAGLREALFQVLQQGMGVLVDIADSTHTPVSPDGTTRGRLLGGTTREAICVSTFGEDRLLVQFTHETEGSDSLLPVGRETPVPLASGKGYAQLRYGVLVGGPAGVDLYEFLRFESSDTAN